MADPAAAAAKNDSFDAPRGVPHAPGWRRVSLLRRPDGGWRMELVLPLLLGPLMAALAVAGVVLASAAAPPYRWQLVGLVVAAAIGVAIAWLFGRVVDRHAAGLDRVRARFAFLADGLPVIAWLADSTGSTRFVNRYATEYTGLPEAEILRDGWKSFLHPEDRERMRQARLASTAARTPYGGELRVRAADGTYRWQRVRVRPVEDEDGRLQWLGSSTDVHLEHESATAASKLAAIVLSAPDAIVTVDLAGMVTSWNPGAEQLLGYEEAQMLGRPLANIIPDSERETMADVGRRLVAGESVSNLATRRVHKDGTVIPVSLAAAATYSGDDRITGTTGVLRDMRDRLQAETDLKEALQAKDDFLGMVSHELRTPLTVIVGHVDILTRRLSGLPPEHVAESIDEIATATKRLQRGVENMLTVSRLERGELLQTEPAIVSALVRDIADDFREAFPGTSLTIDVPSGIPPVDMDQTSVSQVLWNLLTNAVKYGPDHGRIDIAAVATDGHVDVSVSDRGPGISATEIPQVFEPFYRSSSSASQAHGLGLGLSVCRRLMEAQSGEMFAQPREGGGLVIGFRLPTSQPSADQ